MNGPLGEDLPGTLDLAAIAADDALLDQLAASGSNPAVTWDGSIEEPAPISDAVIWTDEPVRPPSGPPLKKSRSEADVDPATRLLALVVADADSDLASAAERMREAQVAAGVLGAPGVTWSQAGDSTIEDATPGLTWGRLARRTGTRGAAVLAALAVSVGGVAAASVVAGPGNPLYPVHKLFAGPNPLEEQAYAAARVSAALDEAQRALDAHKPGLAHGKLTVAQARLKAVAAGTAKDALVARLNALTALVAAATPPTPAPGTTGSQAEPTDHNTPTSDATGTPTAEPSHSPSGDPSSSADPSKGGGKDGKGGGNSADPGRGTTGNGTGGTTGNGNGKDGKDGKSKGGSGDSKDGGGKGRKVTVKSPSAGSSPSSTEVGHGTASSGNSGGGTAKTGSQQGGQD